MTSSKKNNWDKVMDGVNKALPTKAADNLVDGLKSLSGTILDPPEPPTVKSALENISPSIYTRIATNLDRVKNMLNGEKAEEYGNPRIMCRNISKRWFGCDDAETEVALMMAELKNRTHQIRPQQGRLVFGRHRLPHHGISVHAGWREGCLTSITM